MIDRVVSGIAFLLLLPVFAAIAGLIRIRIGRPVLFRQLRIGQHERPFTLYKFRTMTESRDSSHELLPDELRLTPLGRWLRAASADELPQLWNVLTGDMSLVGPRPLLPEYLPLYSPEHRRRHNVKPGITGWAQIRGRNSIDWDERLDLDVWYVDHRSLWLDFRILLSTLSRVAQGKGVHRAGHATMEPFTGSRSR